MKQYREDYYKITVFKVAAITGNGETGDAPNRGKKNTAGNENKLEESISRTRSTIFELALCNDWTWFVTMTLNPEYHDRKDLRAYQKKLSVWLRNYNRLHGIKIKYLLIPELHNDNMSWHIHGLLSGLPEEHLKKFTLNEKIPINILIEIANGNDIYDWPVYRKSFGYITMSKVRNAESISKYITKYVTKNLTNTKIRLNDHLYYCSQGLKRAEKIYQGPLSEELNDEDFSNDFVKIKTVHTFDEAVSYFTDPDEESTDD